MEIGGLQKVSTIDYPGEICCVVFLRGCNFRCGFCHNPGIVLGEGMDIGGMDVGEVLDFLKSRVGKLDAVCVSGGEPLMSLDLDFLREVREMGFKIKIDTNGSFPERLKEIIDLGLVDYIAMDLKGCRRDYSKIVNADVDLPSIEKSMKIVYDFGRLVSGDGSLSEKKEHGHASHESRKSVVASRISLAELKKRNKDDGDFGERYEFRTTVVSRFHNAENLIEMAKWVVGVCGGNPKKFFLQGFRNRGSLVGADFGDERDVGEGELDGFRDLLSGYFGEIGVRV